jgi:hypothetical protein
MSDVQTPALDRAVGRHPLQGVFDPPTRGGSGTIQTSLRRLTPLTRSSTFTAAPGWLKDERRSAKLQRGSSPNTRRSDRRADACCSAMLTGCTSG